MQIQIKTSNLDATFRQLPISTQRKALRPALTEGAKVIQRAAKQNVAAVASKDVTGTLQRNIVVRAAKNSRGRLRRVVQIRPQATHPTKRDRNGPVRVAVYGAVLEYGKKNQPPRSWIRKAIRENESAAIEAVRREASIRMTAAVADARR